MKTGREEGPTEECKVGRETIDIFNNALLIVSSLEESFVTLESESVWRRPKQKIFKNLQGQIFRKNSKARLSKP